MSLSQTEARVMDRWDAGQTLRQIASETRLTLARVTEIVQIYHCRNTTRDHRAQMAEASATLRAIPESEFMDAIRAHSGEVMRRKEGGAS